MICIKKVEDLVPLVRDRQKPATVACAAPQDAESLEALRMAADEGIAKPLAVGNKPAIITAAETLGISLEGFEFLDVPERDEVAERATQLVHDGRASVLMKGTLPTRQLLHAVLDRDIGLRSGRILSHVALFDAPPLGKPVAITDAGVNINPNLSRKIEIVKNATEIMERLGISRPKVAILAAVEDVRLRDMPVTLHAKLIQRIAEAGQLGNAVVQGPLALDGAVSPEVVRVKGLTGPVVGRADILVVPTIESGNIFYKALTYFGGLECAGVLWGATAPVVITSRTDTARVKFLGITLAAAVAGA